MKPARSDGACCVCGLGGEMARLGKLTVGNTVYLVCRSRACRDELATRIGREHGVDARAMLSVEPKRQRPWRE